MTEPIANVAAGASGFTSNAFLVDGDRRVLVDTGADFDAVAAVEERAGGLDAVVLTHTHPDHVGNLDAVVEAFDVDVWGYDPDHAGVDHGLADGDRLRMGDYAFVALHTPGHARDHLCLYAADPGVLFAGDLVFQNGAFGRTDLPGADHATLVESIDRVREAVGEDLRVMHAGHGPSVESDPYRHVEMAARMARDRL